MSNHITTFAKRGLRLLKKEGPLTVLQDTYREFTPDSAGRLTRVVANDRSPTWISDDETFIVQDETADYDDFYTCIETENSDAAYHISSSQPFDSLEFDIVGRSDVSEFTVTGELVTESGDTITESRRFNGVPNRWDNYGPEAVSMSIDESLTEATLYLKNKSDPGRSIRDRIHSIRNRSSEEIEGPRISLPAVRSGTEADQTPIVLVSVDTFRYDHLDCFEALLDEMGDDAVVPEQPRTHAPETKSVHGTMFTGTYPGDHGYVMRGPREYLRPIDPSMTTLSELLAEQQYKCSGLVTHPNLSADRGFGRGFHRYQVRDMDWENRTHDARTNVSTCLQWLDDDLRYQDRRLFYFMHLFDAHVPYFPPNPLLTSKEYDQSLIEELKHRNRDDAAPPGCPVDYLNILHNSENAGEGLDIETINHWYRESLEFVSTQLARLVREMKAQDIYDQALIIVVGDHGEEFFERKFAMHHTLYDGTIRPGAIVKPPLDSDMVVPDDLDIIDILPTIADVVGAPVPQQCTGKVWDGTHSDRPRIAERVWTDYYGISVEMEDIKGIFTFEDNFPDRPTADQRAAGPIESEFYDIERVQNGDFEQIAPSESLKTELLDVALQLMKKETETTTLRVGRADDAVLDRLEELGYR